MFLVVYEHAQFADSLAFGLAAHAAGIHNYQLGFGFILDAHVAMALQQGTNRLAVTLIHLASVCFYAKIH